MRLAFADTSAIVEIPENPEFMAALQAAAAGWPFTQTSRAGDPVATVRRSGEKYLIEAPGEDPVETTAVSAACSALVDLVGAYVDENPGRLCFHCGAVVFSGRLVVFPSRARAGKSTLVARLAASGHIVVCDDILPISDDDLSGIGLGIAPRLRLPLPESVTPSFRAFVSRHAAASDGRYLYLKLPAGGLAPHQSTVPLGAVVLLDRQPEGSTTLARAARGAILQSLIVQNFARAAPAAELLRRLHDVMDRLPRLVLRYSDLEDAAELLEKTFRDWPPLLEGLAEASPASDPVADAGVVETPADFPRDTLFVQNRDVGLHAVDGELFLADAEGLSIHRLNAVGTGLWNLLAEPIGQFEAIEVLCGAFPDADRATVADDVARLFAALSGARFIIPASD